MGDANASAETWDRTAPREYAPQGEEALNENREPHQLFVFVMQQPARPARQGRQAKL